MRIGNRNDRLLRLRNVLNIIFMLCAVVGIVCWYAADKDTGIVILLAGIAVKIVEVSIRILKL